MSRNDDHRHHHHRHRSSHSRDRDRRSHHHHGSHGHRDSSHHSKPYHDHYRSSSSAHPLTNFQQPIQLEQAYHHQVPPSSVFGAAQYPPEAQTLPFSPSMIPPIAFPSQPAYVPMQHMIPFNLHSLPPAPGTMPSLAYPQGLDEKSISASALERLQLPQDKITENGIIPNNPYYDLPAGLMVPLVPADRVKYKPIDPKDLRLPFPKFPDENFLRMIDLFYSDDSDKREYDGWDRGFINIYTKQKDALAKMQSETSQ